ncbi:hypothetical protein Nepgr_000587 [Nepenthes gracilis]|uniref:Uncharacterized protein n=1 Tax=Nepenthes gracilis TaxID=150966 RepID=A0AAD3P5J7_NEPGR|nr:hypothetical protein Nepgr_000587 [Nepenthes gracilis]
MIGVELNICFHLAITASSVLEEASDGEIDRPISRGASSVGLQLRKCFLKQVQNYEEWRIDLNGGEVGSALYRKRHSRLEVCSQNGLKQDAESPGRGPQNLRHMDLKGMMRGPLRPNL